MQGGLRNHLGLDVEMTRFAYPAGSSKASTATVTYAETTTTVSYAASGLETSRTSVVGAVSASRGNYGRDGANRTTSWNVGGIAQDGRATFSDAGKMTSQGGYGWDATATYTYDPMRLH